MSREHSDEMLDLAALAAVGALRGEDAETFERHLSTGCSICSDAMESFGDVAGDLGHAAGPVEPPPALRAAVLDRIAAEAVLDARPRHQEAGVAFARPGGLEWEPSSVPGVDIKVLHRDGARRLITQLVRMQPGSEIPAHEHGDIEELMLIEGDLMVNGMLMRGGDYCRAEPDSLHRASRSPNGCSFLVVTSEDNRLAS